MKIDKIGLSFTKITANKKCLKYRGMASPAALIHGGHMTNILNITLM